MVRRKESLKYFQEVVGVALSELTSVEMIVFGISNVNYLLETTLGNRKYSPRGNNYEK